MTNHFYPISLGNADAFTLGTESCVAPLMPASAYSLDDKTRNSSNTPPRSMRCHGAPLPNALFGKMNRSVAHLHILRTLRYALCLLLFLPASVRAQHTISARGYVLDFSTEKLLPGAKVVLWEGDSLAIDSVVTDSKKPGEYTFTLPHRGQYSVTASLEGYEGSREEFAWTSRRAAGVYVPEIMMIRKGHDLGEVVVKATALKFVVHGDTMIYNADAFNLAEGSVLRTLIKKLPGVTLKADGRIFVNGRFVERLLINGSSLFNNNPNVLLDNLPAYTVRRVKAYNEQGLASKITKRNMDDSVYVMNVELKRAYETGYLGNLEAGGGTADRYRLRGFGMARSKVKTLMAFANMNNLTDTSQGDEEDAQPNTDDGLTAVRKGGVSYHSVFGNNSEYTGDIILSHTDNTWESRSSSETFLAAGNTTQLSHESSLTKSTDVESHHHLTLIIPNTYLSEDLSFSHSNGHNYGNTTASTSTSSQLTNQRYTALKSHLPQTTIESNLNIGRSLFSLDMTYLNFRFSYNNVAEDRYSLDDVRYLTNAGRDYRNNYLDGSSWEKTFNPSLIYRLRLRRYVVTAGIFQTWNEEYKGNRLYRLDRMADYDSLHYDILPSTAEALSKLADTTNTYRYRKSKQVQEYSISVSGTEPALGNLRWLVSLPVDIASHRIDYTRQGEWKLHRKPTFFNPSLQLNHDVSDSIGNSSWQLIARMSSDIPALEDMISYRDDADPLSIRLGNPDLKDIHHYDVEFQYNQSSTRNSMNLETGFHQTDHAVANALTYDPQTGVSTYKPVSVNGNWDADMSLGITWALDREQRWSLENQLDGQYNHCVDMATTSTSNESMRSIVDNWRATENLKLTFRPNDSYEFTLHGGSTYSFIHGRREGFDDIHAGDYNVGLNATIALPWHFQLATDMTMFARRGYQQHEMNTTDWVWNAQLTHSFVKGHLLAKLQGFDILHQLSTTSYAVDAQGRTETWHNSIPRYVMLSLVWRFNINPKK
jgi:hypothetical protein